MAVRWICDGLGLHGGINGDAFKLALADGLGLDRNCDSFSQPEFQIICSDPSAPAGHRRTIKWQSMLEMALPTEGLKVWVLQPGSTGLLVLLDGPTDCD